ncbi:MAG TPA: hypothetical protein VN026_06345 [Bacteroidia bacterium]|jgi:hypothetical protein|nr:hypothetical protein [Bacteroidia bacterium]
MKKFLLLVFSLILITAKAQLPTGSYKDYFKEGSFLMLEENYDLALKNFQRAYEMDSSSANINYNIGVCLLKSSNEKAKAEIFLSRAITKIVKNYKMDDPTEKNTPPLAHFYYGQALHINYKFDEALAQYEKFAAYIGNDKGWKKDIDYYKKQSEFAKTVVATPLNVQISNLGDSINSEYPDFSPVLSADERTLIYTTRRPSSTGGEKTPDGQFFEDIVVSYKDDQGRWTKPQPLSTLVNTNGHEASVNLSADGQTLIVYKSDNGGDIFYSTWDGKQWTALKQFGSDINTKYWESHACLTNDGNTIYFVSDRPGGFGGRDMYRCVKLPNGAWSKALNVGPVINTEYDEDGGFMHPDGKTFFFASKGHKTMGGFDIMFSILDEDNKFTEPFNLWHPINTPDDDVFYTTSPDGKRAYYASAKEGGYGEKDIYLISIPGAQEKPLALFKGQIIAAPGETLPEDIQIVVRDKNTGELIGTYRPKIVNGTFSTILPPGKEYNFSYQSDGNEFYNEDVYVTNELSYQEIKKEITLEPVKLLGKVKIKDKGIFASVIVLNNSKDKKPVPGAKITLTDKNGAVQTFDSDNKGKKDEIALTGDNSYTVIAEFNGKKSAVTTISTKGITGNKIITQLLFLDGKKSSTFNLTLNVTVLNSPKSKKPVANANVVLVGNDGSKYEGTTDAKGMLNKITLDSDVNYDLSASSGDLSSEKQYFTTNNTSVNKVYKKTLYVEAGAVVSKLPPSKYEFHFLYNKHRVDSVQDTWIAFIDNVVALSKKKTVNISIEAMASKVPCMIAFKNNNELAAARATITMEKIKSAVTAKGGDASKLKFSKRSSVGGPAWHNDHVERRAEFEKYQYVKCSAN